MKPAVQSALAVQLVLQAAAEHMKLPAQARGEGNTQLPSEQTPAPTTLVPEQVGVPQLAVGNVQTWLVVWQVPLQAAMLPPQSALVQHPAFGMHADPQGLKPALQA